MTMNRKFWSVLADFLAVVGFCLSVFIACRVFPNCDNTSFDYQAVIVGIIAAIFTLLVGWNIFQVIDWRSERNAVADLRNQLEQELSYVHDNSDYNQALVYAMMSQTTSTLFAPNEKSALKYQMLLKGIQALKMLSRLPNTHTEINSLIASLIKGLNNSTEIQLDDKTCTDLLMCCGEIANRQTIERFDEFVKLIERKYVK